MGIVEGRVISGGKGYLVEGRSFRGEQSILIMNQ